MLKYIIQFICISFVVTFSTTLGVLFYITQSPWVDFSVLEHYNPGKPSIVLDDDGKEWTRFQLDRREPVYIKDIPQHVIKAFLAAEDWNFFKHSGLSFKGIARSLLVNISNGRKVQGASTITQQLVRLLYFDAEKSFKRKIKEQLLAIIVERQFTKEQILETYLNHVYFGCGIYGIEAASQRFWDKHIKDISIDEAAVLASIVQLPQRYCPLYHPDATLKRRNTVLFKMRKLEFITQAEYDSAYQKPVTVIKDETSTRAPHLKETIRLFLEELVGKHKLYSGGLKIQTTLNLKMQEEAEKVFANHFKKFHETISPQLEGALLSLDGFTGGIKALIGGCNFQHSQFNRALKARRQMGSTFKPLVYATALASGKSLADIEIDEPITLADNDHEWSPNNSNHRFEGPMTLARALMRSNNTIAIKTFLQAGPEHVVHLAQRCGIKGVIHPYPSLALGCIDGTLSQAATLINIFAHHGILVEPHCMLWVKDEWGKKIWRYEGTKRRVLNPRVSDQVAKVLSLTLEKARKRAPHLGLTCEALGKTGTTNDARTCWFTGATPEFTTAVYVGCDDNRPLGKNVFASKTSFFVWREFNKALKSTIKNFSYDPALQEVTIHALTGQACLPDDPHALTILRP